jgi:hypothetical protein
LELALLENAEQLDLDRKRKLADLVEKERAAVGELETAAAPFVGAGEGAALVAEKFALDDRLGKGGAVDRDEGPPGALGWRGRRAPCLCRFRR